MTMIQKKGLGSVIQVLDRWMDHQKTMFISLASLDFSTRKFCRSWVAKSGLWSLTKKKFSSPALAGAPSENTKSFSEKFQLKANLVPVFLILYRENCACNGGLCLAGWDRGDASLSVKSADNAVKLSVEPLMSDV